jgi:hypothetical protein
MGDSSDIALHNEGPVHNETLDAFWMARTELTFKQRWHSRLSGVSSRDGNGPYPIVNSFGLQNDALPYVGRQDGNLRCDLFPA